MTNEVFWLNKDKNKYFLPETKTKFVTIKPQITNT